MTLLAKVPHAGGSAGEGIGADEGSGEVAVRSEAPCEVEAHATAGDCREKDCPRTLQTALLTMYNLEYSEWIDSRTLTLLLAMER